MQVNVRRAAWRQGATVALMAIALVATLVARLQRPFDRDTLAIEVAALQSHAAEASELAILEREDRFAAEVTGEHADQLAEDVQRTQDALAKKPAEPDLATQRASAQLLGAALHARLQAWSRDGRQARVRDFGFDALARQFGALHTQLKPEE